MEADLAAREQKLLERSRGSARRRHAVPAARPLKSLQPGGPLPSWPRRRRRSRRGGGRRSFLEVALDFGWFFLGGVFFCSWHADIIFTAPCIWQPFLLRVARRAQNVEISGRSLPETFHFHRFLVRLWIHIASVYRDVWVISRRWYVKVDSDPAVRACLRLLWFGWVCW